MLCERINSASDFSVFDASKSSFAIASNFSGVCSCLAIRVIRPERSPIEYLHLALCSYFYKNKCKKM